MKFTTAGAIGASAALPLVQIIQIGVTPLPGRPGNPVLWAIIATACYLPLHLRHVVYAVRGIRPPGASWTLAAMAAVIFGALPLVGQSWLWALSSLAVSVLLLLRPPWSALIFAGLTAAPIPLSAVFSDAREGPYLALSVVWRSMPFVLVWLAGAVRELESARNVLADQAVEQEQLRIDAELRRTLGAALESIASRGATAQGEHDLRELVAAARKALAESRRMVRGYQQGPLRSELDTAAGLLRAAGLDARVVVRDQRLLAMADETLKKALHDKIAGLLRDTAVSPGSVIIAVEQDRIRFEVRTGHGEAAITEVAAS